MSWPKLNTNPGAVLVAVVDVGAPLLLPVLFCAGLWNWKEGFGRSDAAAVDVVPLVVGVSENAGLGASAGLVNPNGLLVAAPGLPNIPVVWLLEPA